MMTRTALLVPLAFFLNQFFFGCALNLVLFLIGTFVWSFAYIRWFKFRDNFFLSYFMGLWFFYPVVFCGAFRIHNLGLVFGAFGILFFLSNARAIYRRSQKWRLEFFVVFFWVVWTILGYLQVAISSLYLNFFPLSIFYNPKLVSETTQIKLLMMQFSVFFIYLPALALRNIEDFQKFYDMVIFLSVILVIVSCFEYFYGRTFLEFDFPINPSRMTGFATGDAEGFARVLLFPLMIVYSKIIVERRINIARNLICFGGILFAFIFTFSRTGATSILGGFLAITAMALFLRRKGKAVFAMIFLITMIWVVINYTGYFQEALLANYSRLSSLVNLEYRWQLQEAAWNIIKASPFWGARPGFIVSAMESQGIPVVMSAHNIYLEISASWGAPLGLILVFCVLVFIKRSISLTLLRMKANTSDPESSILDLNCYVCVGSSVSMAIHSIPEIIPLHFIFFFVGFSHAVFNLILRFPPNVETKNHQT